jgi:hypothetical protein
MSNLKLAKDIIALTMKPPRSMLPKPVSDMTDTEYKIFMLASEYLGKLLFLQQQALAIIIDSNDKEFIEKINSWQDATKELNNA